ncbi:hypothetical protein ColTof4_12709 [Colletotrichum tofieldiae]|uniref:Uncharacterized protein n=1 Tax=Colletotrichum tofieldiae TaxID=708197 RepID=A0A166LEU0_9PEZI|nr:hypothetical protein CT0861_04172 [Colletotrichum tofieldiae]GKT67119.1 hypothetical protein ColTof3_14458 [Colletotrichum tofieldiae]GKT80286.1 hypothetical protein ColTof4_12709 [Colletotrichum tofieldiae]GKT94619.1 hypothetical protein Ct61P_12469 [Colletotrichum tofieldiae]
MYELVSLVDRRIDQHNQKSYTMMGNGFDSTPAPGGTPCEVLRVVERLGGAQTTVDRVDLTTGNAIPFYVLHANKENKTVAVLHADPRAQASAEALGTAKYHSLSSKIDVVLRGVPFKMRTNTMGTSHSFEHNGLGYSWSLSGMGMSTGTLYFKDTAGNLLARWRKYPDGRMGALGGGSTPVFEVFVPPQSVDMDMLVVTGLASIEYWIKYQKDSYKAVGEAFGAI